LIGREKEPLSKAKELVQDGIVLDVTGEEVDDHDDEMPFEIVQRYPRAEAGASLLEVGGQAFTGICEDVAPEHTGFDVFSEAGFKQHASCEDLTKHCHNSSIGEQVRVSCPAACFLCVPGGGFDPNATGGPCFDAVMTGIRFRDGPKAGCNDLINYCQHEMIGQQVRDACRLSCGLCQLHVEGPYLDAYGNCADLATHEEPQFTKNAALAGCTDMMEFCNNHPDSYLIRHKCPLTCGICGNHAATEAPTEAPTEEDLEAQRIAAAGGCERRRRFGFCSTRRRRNI